ncbi:MULTISPECIES: DNA polymerase III subunit chi [unclassified Stappia]|uniref:DNA polymerase III subunit chi n=1 Tax=unclassified Stappia TaxID=2629676 RepID=UPI001643E38E|nr:MULTISPECIES: DNA polymerase III subunit chi [unclassified Stappia]
MSEVLFYHLTRRPLEEVLPGLLETCLTRGWRCVVQTGSRERCEALDSWLWTYRDDAFLPHGTSADGHAAAQPIYLTDGEENPNGAVVRFLVDRASPPDLTPYQRGVFLFDGQDPEAVADARRHWKAMKDAGHDITYWQQNEAGRWEKKA